MKPKNSSSRPKFWRSLAELRGDPEFDEFVKHEFNSPTEQTPLSSGGRRRFMQLMGASFALTGCHWKKEKLLPHAERPDGMIPGVPNHYVTTMDLAGVATSLVVKSYDGRPIKIEGNPSDSVAKGGTAAFHQASVLGLYDPDRSSRPLEGETPTTVEAFDSALLASFAAASKKSGAGFAVLSRASSSPSLARLKKAFLKDAPQARWVAYESGDTSGPRKGAELAFGQSVSMALRPERADILVGLDSDLLSAAIAGGIGNARAVASRRDPDQGKMSRIYALESTLSELGSLADHRVTTLPSQIPAIVAYLDVKVSQSTAAKGAQKQPDDAAIGGAAVKKVLDVLAKDLIEHAGKSLVVVGSKYPPEVHALVHRINHGLSNVGKTITYYEAPDFLVGGVDELTTLVADMSGGKVESLLILGGNPVYDAPVDLNFPGALKKVKNTFHLGLYRDETARVCAWHTPAAHFLESWGDASAVDGTHRLAQPLIEAMQEGRSALSVLAKLLGLRNQDPQSLVRETLGLRGEKEWRKAVHDGRSGSRAAKVEVELRTLSEVTLPKSAGLEVIFDLDPAVFDGRFANNGWLQELPHPLSKLTWDNAALIAPVTAQEQGLSDGGLCTVTLDGRSLSLPCLYTPGQAEGTIALALGYGRSEAGVVGGSLSQGVELVGANTYSLRTSKAPHFASGAQVKSSGGRVDLAITQNLWAIDPIAKKGEGDREDVLLRETTFADYSDFKAQAKREGEHEEDEHHGPPHPGDIKGMVHHPPLLNLWEAPVSYDGQKWGMAVDLNKCTGCSSCIIACQAENNTSVIGKTEVAMGREMSWLRVDRYYKGDEKSAEVRQQPVMCQQCENAPCEEVCPVGATMHTREGLNDMVYNRCIGTRYCSANCPYKVRRFNYRNYNGEFYGITPYTGTDDPKAKLRAMVFNPEVTVRSRGVMEKCTFCVQRIQDVKITAKNHQRPIKDGEIKTACEQACPSGALVFGDLNDKKSRVQKAHKRPRAYELLQELNNRPRVNYLARISNPHPELSSQDGHSSEHH